MKFENGCFLSMEEGGNKLGALTVSLNTGSLPATTEVIPSGSRRLFMRLAAEQLATKLGGIAILSVSVQKDMPSPVARALMAGMLDMI